MQGQSASITDMPHEIVYMILGHLASLRHVIDCCIALGRSPDDAVMSRATSRPLSFLEQGAPVEFVRGLVRACGSTVPAPWLDAAVLGGRRDTIAWLHGVADIDRMCGVDIDAWPTLPHTRQKKFCAHARRLLKMAAYKGHMEALEWLLDFYDAPRFAARPVIDRDVVSCLCGWTVTSSSRAAVEIVDMLHRRFYGKERCTCPQRIAYAAARADRADVIEWMYAAGCAARPDPAEPVHTHHMIHAAIDAKACSVVRWLSNHTLRSPIVERLLCEILMPHTPQSRREAIDVARRAGLVGFCLVGFWPCLNGIAAGVHGNPRGHPFVRMAVLSLALVCHSICVVLFGFLLLFCIPAMSAWLQDTIVGV